jgi:hypothetical protein
LQPLSGLFLSNVTGTLIQVPPSFSRVSFKLDPTTVVGHYEIAVVYVPTFLAFYHPVIGKIGVPPYRSSAASSGLADPVQRASGQLRNAAAVLHGIHDLRFEEAPPLPEMPPPGSVRIAVKAVGICRSDVHYLEKVATVCQKPQPEETHRYP